MNDLQKFSEFFELLSEHRVDYVVVGGVAAALGGAPVATYDLDLIPDPEIENLARLATMLDAIDATYLDPAGRVIRPTVERLRENRMNLLKTRLGRLDVASEIGDGVRYETAFARSTVERFGDLRVRILDLDLLIATKEFANRDKDHSTLPVLRETLRLKRLKESGS